MKDNDNPYVSPQSVDRVQAKRPWQKIIRLTCGGITCGSGLVTFASALFMFHGSGVFILAAGVMTVLGSAMLAMTLDLE